LVSGLLLSVTAVTIAAQEQPWNPTAIKPCDRACLVGILDGYMNAIFKHDPREVPPLSVDVRMTEILGGEHRAAGDRVADDAAPDAPPGMLQNLVTMETFSVRGGLIHHVEAAPFVTIPYGLGNGWTPGSGR
jgi:hypothetical protein